MERLWAPWRMEYICEKKPPACIFCDPLTDSDDAAKLVLYRGETALVMMNRYPYSNGHLMVAPHRHTADMEDLTGRELQEILELARLSIGMLRREMSPDGFNVGMNLGRTAGAGVDDHLHMHVVPRWNGDTSFMSVVDDVRVIPEALRETWSKLRKRFHP